MSELTRRENELLLQSFGTDPKVQKALQELRSRMTAVTAQLAETKPIVEYQSGGVVEDDPRKLQLRQQLDDAIVGIVAATNRKADRETQLKDARSELERLSSLDLKLSELKKKATDLGAQADRLEESYASLDKIQRLDQLDLSNISVVHRATWPQTKVGPNRAKTLLLGMFLGGLAAAFIAILRALRDPVVRHPSDLKRLHAPYHGAVDGRRTKASEGGARLPQPLLERLGDFEDAIASLWPKWSFDPMSEVGLEIAFVTDAPNGDASRVAGCFAVGLALHGGEEVVYVGCGGKPSWLQRRLGLRSTLGWTHVLEGRAKLEEALVPTGVPGLRFLSDSSEASVAFGDDDDVAGARQSYARSKRPLSQLLDQLAERARFVILELPSLAERPDGHAILRLVDAVEIVVDQSRSSKTGITSLVQSVRAAGATVAGVVLDRSRGDA